MKNILGTLGALCLAATFFLPAGCYYDVEEELYPNTGCDTANVTYTETILPLLEENCLTCHNAASDFGGVTLEGYQNVVTYAQSGQLLGVLQHEDGFSPMPQGQPMLPACTIEKVEVWIAEGALNN